VSATHDGVGPSADGFRSYYGKPVVKEPVWEPTIPAYFFFGGTAGATASLGLAARLTGNAALARAATYANAVAIAVSPPLLIADLGRPERFLNMLRMFKVTSPMSVGTWIVSASGLASGAAAALELVGRLPRAKLAAEATAGALGPFLATYTAALLADTSIPVWHEARRELPFIFAGSSAASAGAACALLTSPSAAHPARRLALAGAALELAASAAMQHRLGFLAEPYRHGRTRTLDITARTLSAAGALGMLGGRRRSVAVGAGALLLAGSLIQRFAVFRAGFASARDPRYTIASQRQRVPKPAPKAAETDMSFGTRHAGTEHTHVE
jgi:polysulfide reductase-like protein